MTEETQTVERTRLVISISGKTAQQMEEKYGFDEKQLGYVTELLSTSIRICGLTYPCRVAVVMILSLWH